MEIRKTVYGEQHLLVAESLNNIALLLYQQGLFEDALPLYEQSLQIKEHCWSTNDLAAVGKIKPKATTVKKPDVDGDENKPLSAEQTKKLHQHNLSIATSYHNLAILCHRIGKLEDAKKHYDKTISIREAFLGVTHADTSVAKSNKKLLLDYPHGGGPTSNLKVLPDGTTILLPNNSGKYGDHLSDTADTGSLDGGGSFITLGQQSDVTF